VGVAGIDEPPSFPGHLKVDRLLISFLRNFLRICGPTDEFGPDFFSLRHFGHFLLRNFGH